MRMSAGQQPGQEQSGQVSAPAERYEVSLVAIAQFAEAIGDPNPLFRDRAAASRAGYPDVIAPPTFPVVLSLPGSVAAVLEALPGADPARVVHLDQRFEYSRPVQAGDVLLAETAVTGVRDLRGTLVASTRTTIRSAAGQHVCTAHHTLAHRPR